MKSSILSEGYAFWSIIILMIITVTDGISKPAFGQLEPNLSEIKLNLTKFLSDNHLSLEDFTIEATENTGNSVEPIVIGRVKATAKIVEDLFQSTPRTVAGYHVLRLTARKN